MNPIFGIRVIEDVTQEELVRMHRNAGGVVTAIVTRSMDELREEVRRHNVTIALSRGRFDLTIGQP